MKTAEIRLNILKTVRNVECYGYEIHKKLESQNKKVEIGRLYKILKEMLTEGLLGCRWEKSEKGPEKRVYRLAEKGRKELDEALLDAISTVHSFYSDYLLNLPTQTSVFQGLAKIASQNIKEHSSIAFFTPRFTTMHERLIASLQNRLKASEICIIHPKQVNLNIKINNTIALQGDFNSIPLRERYGDLLVIGDLPKSQDSISAAKEWYRVLKDNGTLVVIAPTAIFSAFKDPLTIGDFIEKMEHQGIERREAENGEKFKEILENSFRDVQKKTFLQMTVLLGHKVASPIPS